MFLIRLLLLSVSWPAWANEATGTGSLMGTLLFPLILLVIFYFFLIRPQQKKNKEMAAMIEKLVVGDEVTTISGIYGIIEEINGPIIKLKITETVVVQIQKHTVLSPLPKGTIIFS